MTFTRIIGHLYVPIWSHSYHCDDFGHFLGNFLPILWLEHDEIRNVIRPDKPTDGAGQAEFAE